MIYDFEYEFFYNRRKLKRYEIKALKKYNIDLYVYFLFKRYYFLLTKEIKRYDVLVKLAEIDERYVSRIYKKYCNKEINAEEILLIIEYKLDPFFYVRYRNLYNLNAYLVKKLFYRNDIKEINDNYKNGKINKEEVKEIIEDNLDLKKYLRRKFWERIKIYLNKTLRSNVYGL